MNEENPFAAPAVKERSGRKQSASGWIAASILTVLLVVAVLLWVTALAKQRSLESLRSQLDDANASLETARAGSRKNQDQISALQARVADLEQEKAAVASAAKSLEDEMRAGLESKDVTISKLQGKLTVNIMDQVMFDSGEAVLKPGGEAVMRKIAAILAEHPGLKIHVIGHTDNVRIRNRFASNWELSAARALAAVHFLTEKAGVDPRRVGAVAYGEYRPVADNATAEGRAKNRRIAVTILSDELAGAETAPSGKPVPATNSPVVLPEALPPSADY
jgi:chemotaxis protein MotB